MSSSAAAMSRFSLLALICRELFGRLFVLLGGVFFFLGSIYAIVTFDPVNAINDGRLSDAPVTRGRLFYIAPTKVEVGDSVPVLAHHYTYEAPDGEPRMGCSYHRGDLFLGPGFVDVEYDPKDPSISRIRGTRRSPYGGSFLSMILPLVGLSVSLGSLFRGIRTVRQWKSGAVPIPARPSRFVAFGVTAFVLACYVGGPVFGFAAWLHAAPEPVPSFRLPSPPSVVKLYLGEGVDLDFVHVPTGRFRWGGWDGNKDERPPRDVTISGFHLGKYEVTVRQFRRFVQVTGYRTEAETDGKGGGVVINGGFALVPTATWRKPGFPQTDEDPVVLVSRKDAEAFAAWVSRQAKLDVRLPTEAQWEYAARGGTGVGFPWGNTWDAKRLNHGDQALKDTGFAALECSTERDGFAFTAPVGRFPSGASWCGAMDLAGNVFEWTRDPYEYHYYAICPAVDPPGPDAGASGNIRGGGWAHGYMYCRSRGRYAEPPESRWVTVGFRVALY